MSKKEKEKQENEKKSNSTNLFFFVTSFFLYRKIYNLLENIFGKTLFILLHLYYSFLPFKVIGNASNKHQHPYRFAEVL